MIERNQEWATLLRAELKSIWDGYEPEAAPAPVARDAQVPEQAADPGYIAYTAQTLSELEVRRAARRAEIASAAAADQRGA